MKQSQIKRLVSASLLLAISFVLPYLTGQIPEVGKALLPMHLPILIAGYLCSWRYGAIIGFIAPLLRSIFLGMPPLVPIALCMAFEMAAYGALAGLLYQKIPSKGLARIYISLIGAMIGGRIVWGLFSVPIYALFSSSSFTLALFWSAGFASALPGILLQLVVVPLVVYKLEKGGYL